MHRFVWDQAWAELSYEMGKAYYPKLQVGYTATCRAYPAGKAVHLCSQQGGSLSSQKLGI